MSAMHHDISSDLKVVGNKLRDILEVIHVRILMELLIIRVFLYVYWFD